jgi:hypothetical protein
MLESGRSDLAITQATLTDSHGWPYEVTGTTSGSVVTDCAVTGIPAGSSDVPADYALFAPRPNPFGTSTTIRFGVPGSAGDTPIELRVVDPAGRVVRRMVDGSRPAGYHQILWDFAIRDDPAVERAVTDLLQDPDPDVAKCAQRTLERWQQHELVIRGKRRVRSTLETEVERGRSPKVSVSFHRRLGRARRGLLLQPQTNPEVPRSIVHLAAVDSIA